MAIQPVPARSDKDVGNVLLSGQQGREVHHLTQADGFRPGQHVLDICQRPVSTGAFMPAGGHATRSGEKDIQRRCSGRIAHGSDAFYPGNVRHLVGIGDDGARAVRHNRFGETRHPQQAGLGVNMGIDERRRYYFAVQHNLGARQGIVANTCDHTGIDGDVGLDQFLGKHVQHASTTNDQFRFVKPLRYRDSASPFPLPLIGLRLGGRKIVAHAHGPSC